MKKKRSLLEMMEVLNNEHINTWFDLGLFIDRVKEENTYPTISFKNDEDVFFKDMGTGGIGFLTFYFAVDGVTIEVEKYAKTLKDIFPNVTLHYIAGEILPEADELIDKRNYRFTIPEAKGFDNWPLYNDFFHTHLDRGSAKYNQLIKDHWKETCTIAQKLAKYIEEKNINLLYLINVCSNPGNVSLSLACVLVSELMGIPVINNCHDYYWEGGSRKEDIKQKKSKEGPRDFFFTNAHLGEFFSQIEVLFPWQSRIWLTLNINRGQSKHVIYKNGHNPANVSVIGTAVDLNAFLEITKRNRINAFRQITEILARYQKPLIAYSVKDVIQNKLVDQENPEPILLKLNGKTAPINKFSDENILFLQPTRIIGRKRIGVGFQLVKRLFSNKQMVQQFKDSPNLKITILISGPIPMGQFDYFKKVLNKFNELCTEIPEPICERIFLAFTFSEMDKDQFKLKYKKPLSIPQLYSIASLVLLPSKTEGRGLPIIEAAASGVPIFCRRYYPQNVYADVIGEHLPENERLKVIEFDGKEITQDHVLHIISRVFFPHKYIHEINQNLFVVKKRYSLESLNQEMKQVLKKLYLQLKPNQPTMEVAVSAINEYQKLLAFTNPDLESLLNAKNRQYLPGYNKLAFMVQLKSLIDPSYFRVEEQETHGKLFDFAKTLIESNPRQIPLELKHTYYNAVESLFKYRKGELNIRHDHSLAYRHRNNYNYPYRDFTFQEITGLINLLYIKMINPTHKRAIVQASHFFTDWNLAIMQLTSSTYLAIDDRLKLFEKLKANVPIAYFPGKFIKYELEFFALQSIRARLKLPLEKELTEQQLEDCTQGIAPIYIFAQKFRLGQWLTKEDIEQFFEQTADEELKLLYKYRLVRIIESNQLSIGIDFKQIGQRGLKILRQIRDDGGFIICVRRNSAIMTDIVDIDRFHIGKASYDWVSNYLGIPLHSGYVQYVPAGLRATIAYPTPVQTAKEFSQLLKSPLYRELCDIRGELNVLEALKEDAETKGNPAKVVLERLKNGKNKNPIVDHTFVTGLYPDGLPWNGALASISINTPGKRWNFSLVHSPEKTKTVPQFVKEFNHERQKQGLIAWNGGYILNAELVGKLGLPESYIGSPLGLLISDGITLCPPLFNKPALVIYKNGQIDIARFNCNKGITLSSENSTIHFNNKQYNKLGLDTEFAFFDLLFNNHKVETKGRTIIRMAGNKIMEVIDNQKKVSIIPVGLTLAVPSKQVPPDWKVGTTLNIKLPKTEEMLHAVGAGPMLLDQGEVCIDMEQGGWKHPNSIKTQAARLDYTDMRGPKIAAGIDANQNLKILTINGRIRESVGARHHDMAEILKKYGIVKAMGFDPGGSSTLVVDGQPINISPYNKNYEQNVCALPPEPRAVANAIIGYLKNL